jgi:hypothetical protein
MNETSVSGHIDIHRIQTIKLATARKNAEDLPLQPQFEFVRATAEA